SDAVVSAEVSATSGSADPFVGFIAIDGTRAGLRFVASSSAVVNTLTGATVSSPVSAPVTLSVSVRGGQVYGRVNLGAETLLGASPERLYWAELALLPTAAAPLAS